MKTSTILVMTILILALTSSLLADKEVLAVDPSMMPPSPAEPPLPSNKNADQQEAITDNSGVVSKQLSPDIKAETIIDSQLEKKCFNALITGIVDATSGEFVKNADLLRGAAMVSQQAAYEYFCYIAGGNIVALLLEKP